MNTLIVQYIQYIGEETIRFGGGPFPVFQPNNSGGGVVLVYICILMYTYTIYSAHEL